MKTYFLLLFCFLPFLSVAQFNISGQVLSPDNQAVEYATVSVFPISDTTNIRGVITNPNDGLFQIEKLEAGEYQLTIQMLGYQDWEQKISLHEDLALGKITLQEEATLLETVEVLAEHSTLESRLGKKVLRIGQDLSSTGSNALEALDNIPSVVTNQRGQVQIRGNSNVIIYVNGKETRRDPSTLKYISAESLDRIEVITNPSSKYDAEGVAGIINLVYRKDKQSKFKLEAISSLSVATNPIYLNPNGGLNASISKDKISFFTNASLDYGRYEDFFNSKRNNFEDSLRLYETHVTNQGLGIIANVAMGFTIEPDTTLSMGLEVNYDRWDLVDDAAQNYRYEFADATSTGMTLNNQRGELENELWVNYSLEKELRPKNKLKISLTAGGEDEGNFSKADEIDQSNLPVSVQQFLLQSKESERQRYYQGKVDFEAPFFKFGKIEAGIKADFINYDILQKAVLRSESIVLPDNDFSMDMQKLGVYLLQSHRIKKLEYSLGLRMEQFSSEAIQRADQSTFTQNYLRLFPSVQFNYWLPDQSHTLGFNYTQRINRPSFFDLNPFISYSDPLNLETGNPALRPEIAHLYELTYHKGMDKLSMDFTMYRRVTLDAIQSSITSIGNDQSLENSVNLEKQINQGIEAQLDYRMNKFFRTTASFTMSRVAFFDSEQSISFNQLNTWSARLKQTFSLANNLRIELTETYRAPRYEAQRKSLAYYYINFDLQKKFNNKRGSISLGVRDIFNTRQYAYLLQTERFSVEKIHKWQTRQVVLGLRYLIFKG